MTRDGDSEGLSALTQGGREMSETATQRVGQNPLQYVSDQLVELRAKGMAPKLRVLEGEQKPVCVIDGRERSEEHTSELQSPDHLVCRLLLEKKTVEPQRKIDAAKCG